MSFLFPDLSLTAYTALEQQLESLGQRWAAVCRWVEERWVLLQELHAKWQAYTSEQQQFADWLSQKEEVLARMRLVDMTDINEVVQQVGQLKVCTLREHLLIVCRRIVCSESS